MNRSFLVTTLIAILSLTQLQSSSRAIAQTPAAIGSVADGTPFFAELASSIDSKKAKEGDAVTARLTEAIKSDGKIVLPKGTKLLGHITQSTAKAKGDPDSVLGILFDKAAPKDAPEIPLSLSIVAIAAGQRASLQSGPDQNVLAGTGSAAEAGSPMRQAPKPIQGVNGANTPGGLPGASDPATGTAGLSNSGQLTASSRGVFGFEGMRLTASNSQGALISTPEKNLHLDSGTRLLLIAQSKPATPTPAN